MKNDELELIQNILDGNQDAFATLVKDTKKQFMHLLGGKSVIST